MREVRYRGLGAAGTPDVLAGEDGAETDFSLPEADAAALRDSDGLVVDRIVQVIEPPGGEECCIVQTRSMTM